MSSSRVYGVCLSNTVGLKIAGWEDNQNISLSSSIREGLDLGMERRWRGGTYLPDMSAISKSIAKKCPVI